MFLWRIHYKFPGFSMISPDISWFSGLSQFSRFFSQFYGFFRFSDCSRFFDFHFLEDFSRNFYKLSSISKNFQKFSKISGIFLKFPGISLNCRIFLVNTNDHHSKLLTFSYFCVNFPILFNFPATIRNDDACKRLVKSMQRYFITFLKPYSIKIN